MFRRDDVFYALFGIVGVQQFDAVFAAILFQVARLQRGWRIENDALPDLYRMGWNNVRHHGQLLAWPQHSAPLCAQTGEGLRAGVFIHDV